MKTGKIIWCLIFLLGGIAVVPQAEGSRFKDIAGIEGVRDNQLFGYGLVVGLNGTGDSIKNGFTEQTLSNMLSKQGLAMKGMTLKADNVAAVMVTAKLPPFAKAGTTIDIQVSSLGDADSLFGGHLLVTPIKGVDGKVYAVAQGPVIIGGFSAGGSSGGVVKNHTTVGCIPDGALVERELDYDFGDKREFTINLHNPDFTTCQRMAEIINAQIAGVHAVVVDFASIRVSMEDSFQGSIVALISAAENLEVTVDSRAVVVMNERTGTIVMGENVRISTVAIAHGNLSIVISEDYAVSQPRSFAPSAPAGGAPTKVEKGAVMAPGGQTVVTTETTVGVTEEKKKLMVVNRGVTIQEVVGALNAIGVSPRDLIDILQTIKAAGALQADLKIL
ncbi:MAG: flagellar basal body P-ring protein FlgI [Syntrophales bacterium]|nr:flagellar basal body P-ring protein FlgI [Syntrophales bacterium]